MNGLPQGLEHRLGQMSELASYLGLGLLVLSVALAVAPIVIWWNTARTNRLLGELIEEQEKTNELLAKLKETKEEEVKDNFSFESHE